MDKIKKIGETEIYKGSRVHLFKEQLLMPNGKEVEWELIKHIGAAAIIPVADDGRIIMVRQYRNAADDYTLEIPAGILDSKDEEPLTCAHRELEEETGYKSNDLTYLYKFYSSIGLCDEIIYIYIANNLIQSQQDLDDDEFVTLERYTVDELMTLIRNGELMDNKSISSILMYRDYLARK
ncbi:MAG: NUDIX hydrolase [Vallitaleaceae bacterium]|jgi:ADP-ribose pyrophosphatase|nr:NUDIX hydrolase [Vallitaleaceae bacterium]